MAQSAAAAIARKRSLISAVQRLRETVTGATTGGNDRGKMVTIVTGNPILH
jgi:hypothetical protein